MEVINNGYKNKERQIFLARMFAYFRNCIHNSKPAQEYIELLHLDYEKTAIGYNAGQFHHGERKEAELIKCALECGLLLDTGIKSKTGEKAYKPIGKRSICFPLQDMEGNVVNMFFINVLLEKLHRECYLLEREGLYPQYPKKDTEKLIITETIPEAAVLYEQEAIKSKYGVLSLYGNNCFTEEHAIAIQRLKTLKEIIFFMRSDKAKKHAERSKTMFSKVSISYIDDFQEENICSLLDGHSKEILSCLLENRQPYKIGTSFPEEDKKEEITFNRSNPNNLLFYGKGGNYQVKGFKTESLDSLRITLQVTKK